MNAVVLSIVLVVAVAVAIFLWDEIVDVMTGLKRRGHRRRHDVERTIQLRLSAARARARVPRQRGPRHRRL